MEGEDDKFEGGIIGEERFEDAEGDDERHTVDGSGRSL